MGELVRRWVDGWVGGWVGGGGWDCGWVGVGLGVGGELVGPVRVEAVGGWPGGRVARGWAGCVGPWVMCTCMCVRTGIYV